MKPKQLILSIATVTMLILLLYQGITSQSPRHLSQHNTRTGAGATPVTDNRSDPVRQAEVEPFPVGEINNSRNEQTSTSKLLEVYGRVVDRDGLPIEDALIYEQRYFFNTRSDALGNYKLLMELPRHRYPSLLILRNGYATKQVKLTRTAIQQNPFYELNLSLEARPDNVKLPGWVGNEMGIALEGARVELTAHNSTDRENFSLTVFTDENGDFILEGMPSGELYKLSVNLAPSYPAYQDNEFVVDPDPQQLTIILKSIKFIDINGMIQNQESAPIPNFEIYVNNLTTGIHSKKIVSDSSGFFTLEEFPPGDVSLSTRGPEYFRITGLTLSDIEYRNLVLIVDKGDYFLSGWVSDENGLAVEKAMVTVDATIRDGPVEYYSYRSQTTDASGKFEFQNLGGSDHRVSVYAVGFDKQVYVHRFGNRSDQIHLRLNHP